MLTLWQAGGVGFIAAAVLGWLGLAVYRRFRRRGAPVAGDPMALVNTLLNQEIERRNRSESERARVIAELERRNAEMERFTYTVSHDLKSPLVTIRGFLGMLRKDLAAGRHDRMPHDIDRIEAAAGQMSQLLDELLELSRVGRLVHPSESVPAAELARQAVELVDGEIARSGAAVEIAADLPVVFGDRPRLLEVFQNLIENAAKFMGEQPAPRIEVGCRRDAGADVLFVRDNGVGVDARYRDKIFGLFERLDAATPGTGVGLALVWRIVDLHGGRIWVESEGPGHGSTFCFTLPPAAATEPAAPEAAGSVA